MRSSTLLSVIVIGWLADLANSQVMICNDTQMIAEYRIRFEGMWTQENFPKVYPQERPKAEWSSLIGRTHSAHYNLFRVGELATDRLIKFAERGDTTQLSAEAQGSMDILDSFSTSPVGSGSGVSETVVFADARRGQVSMVAKIVPSPDWFVGVDSIPLCKDGQWQESGEHLLRPLDAGSQQGFTFSSPRWRSDPQEVITEITNSYPNRSADAFYYPHLSALPPIAKVHFKLLRTLKVVDSVSNSAVVTRTGTEKHIMADANGSTLGKIRKPPVPIFAKSLKTQATVPQPTSSQTDQSIVYTTTATYTSKDILDTTSTLPSTTHHRINPIIMEMLKKIRDAKYRKSNLEASTSDPRMSAIQSEYHSVSTIGEVTSTDSSPTTTAEYTTDADILTSEATTKPSSQALSQSIPHSTRPDVYTSSLEDERDNRILPPDYEDNEYAVKICTVSPWSEWSDCSRTCGYGVKTRTRDVLEWTGDVACPELSTEQLCGSMRQCNWNHFSLKFNSSQSLINPKKRQRIQKINTDQSGEEGRTRQRARLPSATGKAGGQTRLFKSRLRL